MALGPPHRGGPFRSGPGASRMSRSEPKVPRAARSLRRSPGSGQPIASLTFRPERSNGPPATASGDSRPSPSHPWSAPNPPTSCANAFPGIRPSRSLSRSLSLPLSLSSIRSRAVRGAGRGRTAPAAARIVPTALCLSRSAVARTLRPAAGPVPGLHHPSRPASSPARPAPVPAPRPGTPPSRPCAAGGESAAPHRWRWPTAPARPA